MKSARNWFRRTARSEDGAATIPFIIFVPFFLTLLISSVEMGILLLRDVMLQRGLDMTVRDLRLGTWEDSGDSEEVKYSKLKQRICDYAGFIPDCMSSLHLELTTVSKVTWEPLNTQAECVDRNEPVDFPTIFTSGVSNDMMLVRACVKFDPVFPTTGLGLNLQDEWGEYRLISATAFVNEPRLGS